MIFHDPTDIPLSDYPYPRGLYAELPPDAKRLKADEIAADISNPAAVKSSQIIELCQHDFRLSSLVGYRVAQRIFSDPRADAKDIELFDRSGNAFMPVRYAGGNMEFGRVFVINHCAFPSADSMIGFRNAETQSFQEYFKILKGLTYFGTYRNWTVFKLSRSTTDDMTGMLYSPLEKNFTIEFAHFPHEGGTRILFRWVDS